MKPSVTPIASLADLMTALSEGQPRVLELQTSVACPYSIGLPAGYSLVGKDKDSCILSFCNGDGIALTADNRVSNLTVLATPAARAIYTQAGLPDMGSITLSDLSVMGHPLASCSQECKKTLANYRDKNLLCRHHFHFAKRFSRPSLQRVVA